MMLKAKVWQEDSKGLGIDLFMIMNIDTITSRGNVHISIL